MPAIKNKRKKKKKKKKPSPPRVVLKFERGDLVSWQEDGKLVTGFVTNTKGFDCPGYLDVRARGDVLGRLLPIAHATLRLKRTQVEDYWFWL